MVLSLEQVDLGSAPGAGDGDPARTAFGKGNDNATKIASMTPTTTAAVGNDSTDNTATIQAEIDAIAAAGGGVLYFPAGTYQTGALTWKDRVVFRGENLATTIIKLKNGEDDDLLTTEDYAALVSTGNQWLVSEGVLSFIGLKDIQLDGNKANQSAGDGIKSYAKGIYVENVIIRDMYGIGWLSYGGDKAGQTDWYDLPEGRVDGLWIRNCGSHGWQMRGPHDMNIEALFINASGGDGIRIERSANDYSGTCDIGLAHIYANTGYGVYANTSFRCRQMISESNYKEGMFLDGADQVQISMLQLYNNCRSSGSYQLIDTSDCSYNTISQMLIRPGANSPAATGGAYIQGDYCQISDMQILGDGGAASLTGIGLRTGSDCLGCRFSGVIRDMDGTGAIGLQTGGGFENKFDLYISNCETLWNNAANGNGNAYSVRGRTSAGQAVFSGSGPNSTKTEDWNVRLFDTDNTVHKMSRFRGISSSFALDAAAGTSTVKTFTHNLIATPNLEDVQVSLHATDSGGGTSYGGAGAHLIVQTVSSTQIAVKTVNDRAGAAGSLGYVLVEARL